MHNCCMEGAECCCSLWFLNLEGAVLQTFSVAITQSSRKTPRLINKSVIFCWKAKLWSLIALLSKCAELFPSLSSSCQRQDRWCWGIPRLPAGSRSSAGLQGNVGNTARKKLLVSIPSPFLCNQIIAVKCLHSNSSVTFCYHKTHKVSKFPGVFCQDLEIWMIWKLPFGITLLLVG